MEYYEYEYKPKVLTGIWVILFGLVTLAGVTIVDAAKRLKVSISRFL